MSQREVEIFKDTMKLCETDMFLSSAIQSSLRGQEIYKETPAIRLNTTGDTVKISVTKNRSFESARKYNKDRVCVLNFASFIKAGGGVVNGSTAQEECLCRCSTLYPCLFSLQDSYYSQHKQMLVDKS